MLGRIADHLAARRDQHPLRVAVIGADAGRTTFAIHLCSALAARGVTAIHIGAADFADPEALIGSALVPLGPDGDLRYRERDDGPVQKAKPDSVLVVDGPVRVHGPGSPWDDVLLLQADDTTDPDDGRAGCVVGNSDPDHPQLRRIGGSSETRVRLFSYGTLQLPAVQQASFGRLLPCAADELPGYESHTVTIGDPDVVAASGSNQHPVVRPAPDTEARVAGTVMLLTTAELAAADLYEVDDYRRRLVRLASGVEAWAYVAAE